MYVARGARAEARRASRRVQGRGRARREQGEAQREGRRESRAAFTELTTEYVAYACANGAQSWQTVDGTVRDIGGAREGAGSRSASRGAPRVPLSLFPRVPSAPPDQFPLQRAPPRPRGASRTPLPYEARIRGTGARSAPSARARARGRRRGGWGSPSGEKAFPEFSFAFGLSSDLPPRLTWSRHRGSRGHALGLQHGLWLPEGSRGPVMEPTYGVCRGCQDVEATSQRLACGGTWHTPCAQPPTG